MPVAEVVVIQHLTEECDDTFLCTYFFIANGVHGNGCQYGLLHDPFGYLSVVGKNAR